MSDLELVSADVPSLQSSFGRMREGPLQVNGGGDYRVVCKLSETMSEGQSLGVGRSLAEWALDERS